jgi:hypothetical protein
MTTARFRAGSHPSGAILAVLLSVWFGIVLVTTVHHEYWRDEIRPWSIAGAANSPIHLLHLIRYEAHPALWYLVLYGGRSVVDTPLILPFLSLTIAAAAMAVFMLRSPFPLWQKSLFLFSALPLYEYSVMARNYSLSMLLMFLFAWRYPRRNREWLLLAVVLALLANTNAHSIPLAGLFLIVWAADVLRPQAAASRVGLWFGFPLAIVLTGIAVSLAIASPRPDTILTDLPRASAADLAVALRAAVLQPAAGFTTLFVPGIPWVLGHIVLYGAVLGLLVRPWLAVAAFGAVLTLGVMFHVAYVGSYRHTGLLLCFLLSLYWIAQDEVRGKPVCSFRRRVLQVGSYAAITFLLVTSVLKVGIVRQDLAHAMSASKAFGGYLTASPAWRDAILVPEPDFLIESVPYYADNPIYLPREHRFGNTATWSTANQADLSLRELVSAAQDLKTQYRRPVLVVIGHPEYLSEASADIRYLYRRRFHWSEGERAEAERALDPVASFQAEHGNENYWVFLVR